VHILTGKLNGTRYNMPWDELQEADRDSYFQALFRSPRRNGMTVSLFFFLYVRMYVCFCACMHVFSGPVQEPYAKWHDCESFCFPVCVHVCVFLCLYACIFRPFLGSVDCDVTLSLMCVRGCVCVHIYIYICIIHRHIHTYIYTYKQTHRHTHIHTRITHAHVCMLCSTTNGNGTLHACVHTSMHAYE
jgi:hypothetical protein